MADVGKVVGNALFGGLGVNVGEAETNRGAT